MDRAGCFLNLAQWAICTTKCHMHASFTACIHMPTEYKLQILSAQVESMYVHTLCTNTACHCDGSLSASVCSRTRPTRCDGSLSASVCSRTRPMPTGQDTGECALGCCLWHFKKTNAVRSKFCCNQWSCIKCVYACMLCYSVKLYKTHTCIGRCGL